MDGASVVDMDLLEYEENIKQFFKGQFMIGGLILYYDKIK